MKDCRMHKLIINQHCIVNQQTRDLPPTNDGGHDPGLHSRQHSYSNLTRSPRHKGKANPGNGMSSGFTKCLHPLITIAHR